jgi:predicted RNA-binding protein
MCLSRVYEKKNGTEQLLLNNIQKISLGSDGYVFTDLLENETTLKGKLILADLVNGKVVIETEG